MQTVETERRVRDGLAMLHDFIVANRDTIIDRARQRVRLRVSAKSAEAGLDHGIPLFLSQLAAALTHVDGDGTLHGSDGSARQMIVESAALHGHELLRNGFTVAQVVHGYGDVCQIVTELAVEMDAAISPEDFSVFNRCLDHAIAGAVTAAAHPSIDICSGARLLTAAPGEGQRA